MYDVIVVGARCAGSPLAMLLARQGCRVLVVDAARFPSDTLSTHQIWPPGVAALRRWGIEQQVRDANPGVCHSALTSQPGGSLEGPWHAVGEVDYTLNLRRFKLDSILLDAARAAGADVWEGCAIDRLLSNGNRIAGVSGYRRGTRQRFEEHAAITVGADGHRSPVARLVGAGTYRAFPSLTATYYLYVADFPGDPDMAEIYTCPPREYLFSPTDDGLTVVNLVLARHLVDEFRRDPEENFRVAFDLQPQLAERLHCARPADRLRGVLDQPNFYRDSHGAGWALVGDAGYTKDPIRAQGITDAFLEAEALATAITAGLSGRRLMADALQEYERARNDRTAFPYELCLRAARFDLPPEDHTREFFGRIAGNRAAIAELRGLAPGSIRPEAFYNSSHLQGMMGDAPHALVAKSHG